VAESKESHDSELSQAFSMSTNQPGRSLQEQHFRWPLSKAPRLSAAQSHSISLSEFLSAKREHRLPNYSVRNEVRDGLGFYTVAASQLAQRQLAATVFIITDRAEGACSEWRIVSFVAAVQELASCGMEIGRTRVRIPDFRITAGRSEKRVSGFARDASSPALNPPMFHSPSPRAHVRID